MNQEFNQFYEKELQEIRKEIDRKELGVIDFILNKTRQRIQRKQQLTKK